MLHQATTTTTDTELTNMSFVVQCAHLTFTEIIWSLVPLTLYCKQLSLGLFFFSIFHVFTFGSHASLHHRRATLYSQRHLSRERLGPSTVTSLYTFHSGVIWGLDLYDEWICKCLILFHNVETENKYWPFLSKGKIVSMKAVNVLLGHKSSSSL